MELAIFTKRPAFEEPQCVGKPLVEPDLFEAYARLMEGVFERRYFTNDGPLVRALEEELARRHGVRRCVLVCNATIAQMLVLKALDLEGEIVLPSFTFVATAHACLWQGATPVFCDISPDDLMIDPESVERALSPRTSAVIGVHLFGNVCDVEALTAVCRKHRVTLVFDAGHGFDCAFGETPVGRFGAAEFLSLHATKPFSTFEGGAILTNDERLTERLRFLRNFGFRGYDDVGFLGINGKMPEACAAFGLASLPRAGARIGRLKDNHELYRRELSGVFGVRVLPAGIRGRSNYHYMVILVDAGAFGVDRDALNRVLWEERVLSRRYFYPGCHHMEYFRTRFPGAGGSLPVTERVARQVLCLPTNVPRPERDIPLIVSLIKTVHERAEEVKRWHCANP
jgi:dTDP-4-amino-4,6-dideoxygalactose transaminase